MRKRELYKIIQNLESLGEYCESCLGEIPRGLPEALESARYLLSLETD